MSARRGGWSAGSRGGGRSSRPAIPPTTKVALEVAVARLILAVLRPKYVQPPPAVPQFNYVIDIRTKWRGAYYYIFSVYQVAGDDQPGDRTFDANIARLEHAGQGRFHLAFQRHTGEWITLFTEQTIDECLDAIEHEAFFQA